MIDHDIADVRPALSAYLRQFLGHFSQKPIATHFDNTCRRWLADLPRKSVEPIALVCGTAVRTLQEFLVISHPDHKQSCTFL